MDQFTLAELIKRYRAGTATEKDKYLLEKIWQDALEDTSYLDNLSEEDRQMLKMRTFAETRLRISQLDEHRSTVHSPRSTVRYSWVYRVAAAITLLAADSFIIYWHSSRMIEFHTDFGERLSITLPDHSKVTLNGNSTLRYNKEWTSENNRGVWIDGEGFFAVQHTANHQKFIVHVSGLDVQVLGTKFNVKSREKRSEVMLTEGKVRLDLPDGKTEPVFLKPGELATMTDQKLSKRTVVRQKQYTSWLTYTLIFDRTPLHDVADLLKDTYGLEVHFADETLQTRELSGEISSAHADDILYAIAETFNLAVAREGNAVKISSK